MAKKKKWKKKLGKALMAGAALAGGLALAKNRNRNAMINSADANDGFSDMTLKDYAAHSIGGGHIPRTRRVNPAEWLTGVGSDPVYPHLQAGAKKGGRAGKDFGKRGVGKAKRGFGRALKGGKK